MTTPTLDSSFQTADQFPDKLLNRAQDQNSLIPIPYPRLNCLKTINFHSSTSPSGTPKYAGSVLLPAVIC